MLQKDNFFFNNINITTDINSNETERTFEVFISQDDYNISNLKEISIFVMNWFQHGQKINDETVLTRLDNVPIEFLQSKLASDGYNYHDKVYALELTASIYRIDDNHNPSYYAAVDDSTDICGHFCRNTKINIKNH